MSLTCKVLQQQVVSCVLAARWLMQQLPAGCNRCRANCWLKARCSVSNNPPSLHDERLQHGEPHMVAIAMFSAVSDKSFL
jgi:hypothetical protein